MVDNKENARLIAIVGLVVVMATCMACFLVVVVFNSAYGGETIALRNPFAPPTVAAPAASGGNTGASNTVTNPDTGSSTIASGGSSGATGSTGTITDGSSVSAPATGGNTGSASAYLPTFNGYTAVSAGSVTEALEFITGTGILQAQAAENGDTFSAQSLSISTIATTVIVSRIDEFVGCYQNVGAVDAQVYVQTDLNALINGQVPPLGAVAVINQDRLRDNLVNCAVAPNDPNTFSAQAAQPCGNFGTFRQAGETFTYLYAGTDTSFCNAVDDYYTRFAG